MAQDINAEFARLQQLASSLRKDFSSFNLSPVAEDASLISELLAKWEDEMEAVSRSSSDIASSFRNVVQEISKTNVGINGVKKSFNSLTDIARQLSYQQQGSSKLTLDQIQKLKKKAEQEKVNLIIQKASLETQKAQLIASNRSGNLSIAQAQKNRKEIELINSALRDSQSIIDSTDQNYQDLITQLDLAESQQKRVNEALGLGGNAIKGMETALNKMGLGGLAKAMGLDEVHKKMQTIAEDIEKGGGDTSKFSSKFKVLKGGVGEIGTQLKKSLSDPLVVIGFLVTQLKDAFLSLDTMIGNTAKSMGVSYNTAADLNSSFVQMAGNTGNVFVTTKGINESFNQINAALGTNGVLSEEILVSQTQLVKQAGYSVEAATMLSKLSLATGKPTKDIAANFLGSAKALNLVNGTAINEKQLLEDISGLSKDTLATFASQPGKLAEAAYEARKLGLDLEKLKGTQSALLDIESSIASEFEAEILTGKQLNLEKARYFALTNDYAGLAKELDKQDITRASFAKMNVIQQEATAKALGMSADTMGGMLMDQEAMSKLSSVDGDTAKEKFDNLVKEVGLEEAKKRLGDEALADQMASASTQDKFNASIEKLKELFVTLIDPLMPILGIFGDIAALVGYIITPFTALNSALKDMAGGLGTVVGFLIAAGVAALVLNSSLTFGIGTAIALAAAGAGIVYLKSQAKPQQVQDGTAPSSKGPFTITDKFGATAITAPGDNLAASPNLIKSPQSSGDNRASIPNLIKSPQSSVDNRASNSNLIKSPQSSVVQQQSPSIDYDKMAQALSKVQVNTNIDGVQVSNQLFNKPSAGMAVRKI
jgi:hypothetical protein